MKYSRLAALLTCLASSLGPPGLITVFQEDFAGKHALSTTLFQMGFPVLARDWLFSKHLDVESGVGFMSALQGLRSLAVGGLCWLAVPCSSWVFMSRGTTGRSRLTVRGRRRYQKVRSANRIARRTCYLVTYLEAKGCYWALENPSSSILWLYPPMRRLLDREGTYMLTVPLGLYGASSQKLEH